MENLEKLFNPQSIAIVGASEEAGKVGTAVTKNILDGGYTGEVFLVNNKRDQIFGRPVFRSLAAIESAVDLAIIVIPAKFVNQMIAEASDKIKNFVVISAGFSEIGGEGKTRESDLSGIARQKNLNILGPNCLGFIVPSLKLNASFAAGMPEPGNIALVSQSGALISAVFDMAKEISLKFSSVISIGNKMDIEETQVINYLKDDENTKVIALYLEGIKDGKEFINISQIIQKPIIILKAGKTEKSKKAIASHTGALAGNEEVIGAVFRKCGIIQAENFGEFVDLMNTISLSRSPKNNSVAIVTNAGGPGVLTTDAFRKKEIQLAEISVRAKTRIRNFLPPESSVENPIDLLGDADHNRYQKTLKILGKEEAGTIICVLTPQEQTPIIRIANSLIKFKSQTDQNIYSVFIGSDRVKRAVKKIRQSGIPNLNFPEQAVNAAEKYYLWKKDKERMSAEEFKLDESRKKAVSEIIREVSRQERKALNFEEAGNVMALYQIPTIDSWQASEINLKEVKYPVVVKVDSDKILHKTDEQALILNINNAAELEKSLSQIKNNFPNEKIIVQPMLIKQAELILGIVHDSIFGTVVICGLGGIYTEVFKMADFFIPFQSQQNIKQSLLAGKVSFLFEETRGQAPYNIEEISKIIYNLQYLALENREIMELDINPLLIYNDNQKAVAIDVKIII